MKRLLPALVAAILLVCSPALPQTGPGTSPLSVPKGGTGASNAAGARTNLGVAIGSNVQAWDADLDALAALGGTNTIYYRSAANTWSSVTIGGLLSFSGGTLNVGDAELAAIAGLTSAADKCFYFTGAGTAATYDCLSWARTVIGAANASAARSAFGLAIGTDVQAYNANLTAFAGLTGAAGKLPYFTGAAALGMADTTSYGRSLLNAADAAALRLLAGLNNVANVDTTTQANVSFTGLTAAAAAADADTLPVNQGAGNLKQTFAAIKTWVKGWIAKADVGLGNVDNTSDTTKWAAAKTLTNTTFNCGATGNACTVRLGSDVTGSLPNANLAAMANNTVKGNVSGSSAAPSDLTRAQLTALINPMVGDSGSGGTAGVCPAPGPGDFAAGKYCDAGGGWSVPAGGGGGGGLSDTDRRNILLDRIYQAKALAAPRRVINAWADGFKSSGGINSGSSSNYVVDTSGGKVSPTATPTTSYVTGDRTASITVTTTFTTESGVIANLVNGSFTNNSSGSWVWNVSQTTGYIRFDFGSAIFVTEAKWYQSGSSSQGTFKWQGSNDGSNFSDIGSSFTLGGATTQTITALNGNKTAYRYLQLVAVSASTSNASFLQEIEFKSGSSATADNMTAVTVSQTTDANVGNARVLLEFDNSATPTLNTDLTAEVTCDGGTNWASASLSAAAYSQGGRKVVETVDQACTAGTSFAARIKTANNKNVSIYGVSVVAH